MSWLPKKNTLMLVSALLFMDKQHDVKTIMASTFLKKNLTTQIRSENVVTPSIGHPIQSSCWHRQAMWEGCKNKEMWSKRPS